MFPILAMANTDLLVNGEPCSNVLPCKGRHLRGLGPVPQKKEKKKKKKNRKKRKKEKKERRKL